MKTKLLHPAPFSSEVLAVIEPLLPEVGIVLDPMAGIGRCHQLATETRKIVGIELEPEWAKAHPDTRVGNALKLPFGRASFDAVCTSPCYGNRYADHHNAQDGSYRRSYTHDLRALTGNSERRLHHDNSGTLRGSSVAYWDFHKKAWAEVARVLKPGGPFVLNISDYIERGAVVPMVDRHTALLVHELGFTFVERIDVHTRRMRRGANSDLRVPAEAVLVLEAPK